MNLPPPFFREEECNEIFLIFVVDWILVFPEHPPDIISSNSYFILTIFFAVW
jgi:hypothetical protein